MAIKLDEICCDKKLDADLLTLLGVVNLNFNYAENVLHFFVSHYLELELETADRIARNIHEGPLIELCRSIISAKEPDEKVKVAALTFLDYFDILSENRNIAAHSLVISKEPDTVSFLRVSKEGKPAEIIILRDEFILLCKELRGLFGFGISIVRHNETRNSDKPIMMHPTPLKPRKLQMRQIAQENEPPPPTSFQA